MNRNRLRPHLSWSALPIPPPKARDALTFSLLSGDPQLTTNLFGATPYAHCLLAFPGAPASAYADTTSSTAPDHEPAPIGLALYFFNFSTWTGKPGLYVSTFVLTFYGRAERRKAHYFGRPSEDILPAGGPHGGYFTDRVCVT